MAQVTRNLTATKFSYVREANPSTHYNPSSSTWYYLSKNGKEGKLLFALTALPASLKRNRLYGIRFRAQVSVSAGALTEVGVYSNRADFDAAKVTWNTAPSKYKLIGEREFDRYDKGAISGDYYIPSAYSEALEASYAVTAPSFALEISTGIASSDEVNVKTSLEAGGSLYAVLSYDDTEKVTSRVTRVSGANNTKIDPRTAQTFSWRYAKANTTHYCMDETWAQSSAVFYWKQSTEGSYRSVPISGGATSVTIPANTFPTGATIQWYVSGTDTDGTTTQTGVYSFSTPATQIEAQSFPTGTKVDTRYSIPFTWQYVYTMKGEGEKPEDPPLTYPQSSARLYWRVQNAGTWNTLTVSGGTLGINVPANTFPTGKVIEWYVNGTDAGGYSSSTEVKTFTTVASTVKLSTYPTGSGVYTGSPITFTWYFDSSVGNYPQSSARFYWKKSTENSYRSITVSGNTQQLTVAANTFPTGATIQWYLSGTDSGGTTTQTGAQSFSTLASKITVQDSPTSGYMDPRHEITFQWYFATSGGSIPQSSATLYWKTSTQENYTEVDAPGATTRVSIPANTFPVAATIQWYVTGTDVGGTTSTSPVYSFSTAAATAYAYAQSPIGTAEDGSKPITLRWTLYNSDGSSPLKVTVRWKTPVDVDWTTITESAEAIQSWTAPENYFPVGEVEWSVMATNRDGIDGPVSTAAFICLRSPDPPSGLKATAVPITTVSWQSMGQEAYEISIDGVAVRKAYGPGTSSWTVPAPLSDGIHTISVRIQGPYGFWSDPSVTTIDVRNAVPTGWESLALSGAFGVDAVLTATGIPEEGAALQWYRDGVRIARSGGIAVYTDRFVLGRHEYYAEFWSSDGNYARSNTITGDMKSCVTRIALFDGGEWLDLRLSANSGSSQSFSYSRTRSLRHVQGSSLPVLEMSEFIDRAGSYDCAFKDVESAAAFEALRGQMVIVKSRGGNVLIGALADLSKRYTDFYIAFTFSVQESAWEDFRYVGES